MKKARYIQPAAKVTEVRLEAALMAMSSPENNLHWGGNASEGGLPDPEAKEAGSWDIWN